MQLNLSPLAEEEKNEAGSNQFVHKRRNTSTKKAWNSVEACLKTGRTRKQIRLMMIIRIMMMLMMMMMMMIINPDFLQIWAFVWDHLQYILHCTVCTSEKRPLAFKKLEKVKSKL